MVALARKRFLTPLEFGPEERSERGRGHFRTPMLGSPLSNLLIIKISGKLCEPENLAGLAREMKQLIDRGKRIILIHGGQEQIDKALAKAEIKTEKINGIRVTPDRAIPIIVSVLATLNEQIGKVLAHYGIQTVLVDGRDTCLVGANALEGYGRTGTVEGIHVGTIELSLRRSDVLVMSSLGVNDFGHLNINADEVTRAIAQWVGAEQLILFTDVPGVLQDPKDSSTLIPRVTQEMARKLIDEGNAIDGMAEKIRRCSEAAEDGTEVILARSGVSLIELTQGKGVCTRFLSM